MDLNLGTLLADLPTQTAVAPSLASPRPCQPQPGHPPHLLRVKLHGPEQREPLVQVDGVDPDPRRVVPRVLSRVVRKAIQPQQAVSASALGVPQQLLLEGAGDGGQECAWARVQVWGRVQV